MGGPVRQDRRSGVEEEALEVKKPALSSGLLAINPRRRPTLPHSYPCSTISSVGLNFRVRDGNGCDPYDITTGKL